MTVSSFQVEKCLVIISYSHFFCPRQSCDLIFITYCNYRSTMPNRAKNVSHWGSYCIICMWVLCMEIIGEVKHTWSTSGIPQANIGMSAAMCSGLRERPSTNHLKIIFFPSQSILFEIVFMLCEKKWKQISKNLLASTLLLFLPLLHGWFWLAIHSFRKELEIVPIRRVAEEKEGIINFDNLWLSRERDNG